MKLLIKGIAFTEFSIGFLTLAGMVFQLSVHEPQKLPGVLAFVFTTSVISLVIGWGLFQNKEWARKWLVYFSGYVAIEKILIFLGVISLNGKLLRNLAGIPPDIFSFIYHAFLVFILTRPSVKAYFCRDIRG